MRARPRAAKAPPDCCKRPAHIPDEEELHSATWLRESATMPRRRMAIAAETCPGPRPRGTWGSRHPG
eukprot:8941304-Lingulodinium_polyedra.AAC.1